MMRWVALLGIVAACGRDRAPADARRREPPPPIPPPIRSQPDAAPSARAVPSSIEQLERAAGIDPSNPGPMLQEALDMTMGSDAGAPAGPVGTPDHGVDMKLFQMPQVHFDGALATMSLGRLEVYLVEQPLTCDDLYEVGDAARLSFDVPPGPGNTYFTGHEVGVYVNGDAGYVAAASPSQVALRLARFRVRAGAHIKGSIDVVAKTLPDLEAHGHFDAILCDVDRAARVPASAPSKPVAVGTAIARLVHTDDGDSIDKIELYDQKGLTCDTANGGASRELWQLGGTGAANPLPGTAQPASLAFDPDDFSKTSFWDAWVRFDTLAFTPGDEVRLSMWAQDTDGKKHVGGTLRATVCAGVTR